MQTSAFLISKPLQLIIALILTRQCARHHKVTFLVVEAFRGARDVVDKLKQNHGLEMEPRLFTTQSEAYAYIEQAGYDHVYIDSDVGLRKACILMRVKRLCPGIRLSVFEEGAGSYRSDLYNGLKLFIFRLLGIATHFGANRLVDRIFLFQPEEYAAKFPDLAHKAARICLSLDKFLIEERARLNKIFGTSGVSTSASKGNGLCNIYLSSWDIDFDLVERFKLLQGDRYIKLHPHVTHDISIDGVTVLNGGTLAELVIAELAERYESVQVFDYGTSVRRYLQLANVSFQDARILRD